MSATNEPRGFEVGALIQADLESLQRERRLHFAPALAAWLVITGIIFGFTGIRGGLLDQPWWQIVAQVLVWLLCLVVLPSVGLGLIFPTRIKKVALIGAAVSLTVLASFDWGLEGGGAWSVGPCALLQTVVGAALLGIGGWSGAFIQRARPAAGFWIASGIALAALNTSTWHCADTSLGHVMSNHISGGIAMLLCAAIVGNLLHRRSSPRGDASPGA